MKKQHMFEVTLTSGDAEASVLVAAHSAIEARRLALGRAMRREVSWEGTPDCDVAAIRTQDLGEDEGQ
jgi:hypothetical protein